jgi:hypothetical protein
LKSSGQKNGLNCGLGFKKPRKSMNLWLPLTKVSKQPRRAEFSVLRKSKCKNAVVDYEVILTEPAPDDLREIVE